jgi:putative nucleotidyltransferase with HDIG domain
MKLELTLLRTRVARRMLALFLVCAVVPVVVLGGVAYLFVSHSLTKNLSERLHTDGSLAGQLVLGHLEDLASRLKVLQAPGDANPRRTAVAGDSATREASFDGVVVQREDGTITPVRGQLARLPILTQAQQAQVAGGRPALVVQPGGMPRRLYLVVPGANGSERGYPRTWGYLTVEAALQGLDATREDGARLCLRDEHGPLGCDRAAPDDGGAMVTGTWTLFLKHEFAASAWTLVLGEPEADALSPLRWFRRVFVLGLVFAVLLVFTLSHAQIRQRMTPLADLEAGTRRLRGGDFSTRVTVESDDEFQSLAASFNRMATDLEHQFATLSALRRIDHAALRDRSAGAIAAVALRGSPELLGARAVALAISGMEELTPWSVEIVTAGETSSRRADVQVSPVEIAELASITDCLPMTVQPAWPSYCGALRNHGCGRFVVFPLHGQQRPIGALIVGLAAGGEVRDQLFGTGRQLADQLALGLSNVSLLEELDAMSIGALTALARTVDAASHWTGGHSERVTRHAVEIARRIGLDAASLARLRQGGLLHDIGKIGVPATILDKPGPLSDSELVVMQSHPAIGANIVESVRAFRDLVPLVLHHHELLDGSGYPHGLRGDEIPGLVRILTVADVYDALVSNRPYRNGLGADVALGILVKDAGTKFDERAVGVLREMVGAGWAPSRYSDPTPDAELCEGDRRMLIGVGGAEAAA